MKIVDQFKAASSISIVAEENNLAYSVVNELLLKNDLNLFKAIVFEITVVVQSLLILKNVNFIWYRQFI